MIISKDLTFRSSWYSWYNPSILKSANSYNIDILHKTDIVFQDADNWSKKKWIKSGLLNVHTWFIDPFIYPVAEPLPVTKFCLWYILLFYIEKITLYLSKSLNEAIFFLIWLWRMLHLSVPSHWNLIFVQFFLDTRRKFFLQSLNNSLVRRFILISHSRAYFNAFSLGLKIVWFQFY